MCLLSLQSESFTKLMMLVLPHAAHQYAPSGLINFIPLLSGPLTKLAMLVSPHAAFLDIPSLSLRAFYGILLLVKYEDILRAVLGGM